MKRTLLLVAAVIVALLPATAWAKLAANHNQTRIAR